MELLRFFKSRFHCTHTLKLLKLSFKIFSEYITTQNNFNGVFKTEQPSLVITAIVYQGQIHLLKEKLGKTHKAHAHTKD